MGNVKSKSLLQLFKTLSGYYKIIKEGFSNVKSYFEIKINAYYSYAYFEVFKIIIQNNILISERLNTIHQRTYLCSYSRMLIDGWWWWHVDEDDEQKTLLVLFEVFGVL